MKVYILLIGVFGSWLASAAELPRFDNAISLPSARVRTLFDLGQSCQELLHVSIGERDVQIFFKDSIPSSPKGRFRHEGGLPGSVDGRLLDRLHELAESFPALDAALNARDREKEYIISGIGTGGGLATLAAQRIFTSLTTGISGAERDLIKSNNVVKLIGFYPSPIGDRDFCASIVTSLGSMNCLFFNPPGLLCRTPGFPGIPLDITYSEYFWDNKSRLVYAALYASSIPSFIYLVAEKSPLSAIPGIVGASTLIINYLSKGNSLSSGSVQTAYNYAAENLQMYRSSISLYSIGKIPFCSVRRGLLSWVYKKLC